MIGLSELIDEDLAGYTVSQRTSAAITRMAVGLEGILDETSRQKQARRSRYARKPASVAMPNGVHRRGRKRLAGNE